MTHDYVSGTETTEGHDQAPLNHYAQRFATRLVVSDTVVVLITVAFSAAIAQKVNADSPVALAAMAVITVALWLLILWGVGSREPALFGVGTTEYARVLKASVILFLLLGTVAYVADFSTPRRFLTIGVPLGTVLLLIERAINRRTLGRSVSRGATLHRVLLVADSCRVESLEGQLTRPKAAGYVIRDVVTVDEHLPAPEEVVSRALEVGADTIVIGTSAPTIHEWTNRLGWMLDNPALTLLIGPDIADIAGPRLRTEPAEGLALIRVDPAALSGPSRLAKRSLDIVGALVALAVLALPMAVLALWVKLDSRGPAFFRQARVGLNGSIFICWKFRTMRVGADHERAALREEFGEDGATFKMQGDPRVTRAGRVLRRFSLDELPQLLNVVRGNMSLVGPRPHPLDDVERYDELAQRRLAVKPGMTGLWQVSGRSNLDWNDGLMLDLRYIGHWSLGLDLLLMARTVTAVLRGTGSY